MIKFSLQHIAEHAPYELLLSENDFTFRTDLGIPHLEAITADFEKSATLLTEGKP